MKIQSQNLISPNSGAEPRLENKVYPLSPPTRRPAKRVTVCGSVLRSSSLDRTHPHPLSPADTAATRRFRNALVSVSDKTGLVDFIGPLAKGGTRVVATGGTAQLLKKAGIAVVDLSEQTGFREVMDGRVKSLHPRIYMPLLARLNHIEDQKVLEKEGLDFFDLLVCNLYPFIKKKEEGAMNLTDWIDIGGPSMLRASAKNFEQITVVCDPADYSWLGKGGVPSLNKRKALAGKVFSLMAKYDNHIADWLSDPSRAREQKAREQKAREQNAEEQNKAPVFTEKTDLQFKASFFKQLRYGENPHQKATWFKLEKTGLHTATKIQGKDLSFNNISDLDSAVSLIRDLDSPAVVAVKHNNPCGVACDSEIEVALDKALKADPVSVFGGVIALNRVVSEQSAKLLCSLFLEAVIAPYYSDMALKIFKSKKKNLRVLKWPALTQKKPKPSLVFRSVVGGLLMQEQKATSGLKSWQFLETKPSLLLQADLLLAWKVVSHLKSNAIALVSKQQTVGLGMGHVNRVSAVEMAIKDYQKFHPQGAELVMASDGFFPFPDSIEHAGKAGIKWVVQPGGSLRDKEILAKAEEFNINMILTGQRCFAH